MTVLSVAVLTAASALAVRATHEPTVAAVVAVATDPQWNMSCKTGATQVDCSAADIDGTWYVDAVIKPGSGPLTSLYTVSSIRYTPLDAQTTFFQDLMRSLHNVPCVNGRTGGATLFNFVNAVGDRTAAGNVTPVNIPGECDLTGGLTVTFEIDGRAWYHYWINSVVIVPPTPSPTPSPTPTASPTPTPAPTAPPTATPRGTATPTATSTASPTAASTSSASASASASESASASASGSASASASASASETVTPAPTDSPEQSVAGATFTPEPSAPVGAPDRGVGGWPGSIPAVGDVSTKPADVGSSALAAGLLLVAMGFIGELFNNTMETNYDRILAWWKKTWVGRIGRRFGGLFGGGSS
jgi:hypothetical protein